MPRQCTRCGLIDVVLSSGVQGGMAVSYCPACVVPAIIDWSLKSPPNHHRPPMQMDMFGVLKVAIKLRGKYNVVPPHTRG